MKKRIRNLLQGLLVGFIVLSTLVQFPEKVFAKENDATIYLNSDNVMTKDFEGFGVQWDPSDLYSYTDEQWASFVEKATFLKPNIMRVMLHDGDSYCIGFDENKNPIYDWDSPLMQRTYKILDFAEENNIPIMLGEWRSISERGYLSYDKTGKEVSWDNPIWAKMIVDCLDYLMNVKGYTCIKYYNMVNEPNYYKRDHPEVSDQDVYTAWKTAIKNLRAEMVKSGDKNITNLKIVGPDVYDSQEAWIKQTASADLKDYIDVTEIHRYAPLSEVKSGLIEKKLITWRELAESLDPEVKQEGFGIGEMGLSGTGPGDCQLGTRNYDYGVDIFDYALQAIRAGMKFGSVWGFEDSMHLQATDVVTTYKDKYGPEAKTEEGKKYKVHTPTGDPNIDNDIKIWGFWNELAEEMSAQNNAAGVTGRANTVKASDENIRPWYYTWSMISRYFPKDSQVISASNSRVDGVRATAVIIPSKENKNDISIAAVNSSHEARTVTLSVPNATTPMDLTQYFYYDGEINGKTRPQNAKSEVLPYDTLKNCDLSKGVQIELPARTALILTTLGYNGEKNPVSMTTGQKPDAQFVEVSTESDIVELNKPVQMNAIVEPEGADTEVEWTVTDYFGKPTEKASISQNGILTMTKVGQIKVVAKSKLNPSATGSKDIRGTKTGLLIDKLQDINGHTVAEYQGIVVDDNPANFGGIKTIKRSDSNANGNPGIITYQGEGIYKAQFHAYALKTNLDTSGNFKVEVSKDKMSWDAVNLTSSRKSIGSWYAYEFEATNIDKSQNYQYLRVTLKSQGGYKTYEPQYSGCEISFGEQSVSNITIQSERQVVAKNQELQFNAKVEPVDFSQDIVWQVCDKEGNQSSLASISNSGLLQAKQPGQVIVVATTKNGEMSAYQTVDIVSGYFVDEIADFSKMYQYDDFAFEKADPKKFTDTTIIKRLTNTNQSIVYAFSDIQQAQFELYKNGVLDPKTVDIYTSQDGLEYKKVDKVMKDIGRTVPNSEYYRFSVSSKSIDKGVNFVKLEVKNDESVYCPMIGKSEIIYNQETGNKIIDLNIDQKSLSVHMNETLGLNLKVAPMTANQTILWESQDTDIAIVDSSGRVTGKKAGSTIIYAKYNDNIYASCVVNVLNENMALKEVTRASSDTNEWEKNPTKALANDGDMLTRWVSKNGTNITKEYLEVDLGEEKTVDNVKIFWETARAKDFNIEVSLDGTNYTAIKEIRGKDSLSLTDDISFDATKARFVRMQGLNPVGKYGYSIYEFRIYNNSDMKNVETLAFDNLLEELYVGEKIPLKVKFTPQDAVYQDVTYQSSDNNVLTIHHNQLIAVGLGKATITATLDGKVIAQEITVVEENVRKIANSINTVEIKGNQLVLPEYDDYIISIASSDIEKIVDKKGIIHQPVKTTDVRVVLNVKEKTKSRNKNQGVYTDSLEIRIVGQDKAYKELLELIKDVTLVNGNDYTEETMKTLKTELTHTYEVLLLKNLLVSEVESAYNSLQKAYTSLQKKIEVEVEPNQPGGNETNNSNQSNNNVQTSDTYNVLGYTIIITVSLTLILFSYLKKKE